MLSSSKYFHSDITHLCYRFPNISGMQYFCTEIENFSILEIRTNCREASPLLTAIFFITRYILILQTRGFKHSLYFKRDKMHKIFAIHFFCIY